MHTEQDYPLILTLRLDEVQQAFFNQQRKLYFPPERNYLDAHLTLFHQLPDIPEVRDFLLGLDITGFDLQVIGLRNLGAGVAYLIDSADLSALRKKVAVKFSKYLIPQDQQGFRPHITIMNKTTPEQARNLLAELSVDFQPFTVKATGLDLWAYLGGPWRHEQTFSFA